MDQEIISKNRIEDQTISPEEDSKLLAIEALEARTVDPNPRPLIDPNPPRDIPVPARSSPVAVQKPEAPKPIVVAPKPLVPAPKPIADVTPVTTAPTPTIHIPPQPEPAHVTALPPKPKKKGTPSEEMAEELAAAPTTTGFQFFAGQRSARKPFVVIAIIVVVIAIGVGAYFFTR